MFSDVAIVCSSVFFKGPDLYAFGDAQDVLGKLVQALKKI
jgi:hypothetical protein